MKRLVNVISLLLLAAGLAACQQRSASRPESATPSATPVAASTPAPAEAATGAPAEAFPAEAPTLAGPPAAGPAARPAAAPAPAPAGPAVASTEPAPAAAAPAAAAPAAPAPTPTPTPAPPVVAAGTDLRIRLQDTVTTKTAKAEDPVVAVLAEDVVVKGAVVLPSGSEVAGHVVSALRSGRVKGKAQLVVAFDRIRVGSRTYQISATGFDVTAGSSKGKDAKIAGGAAAAGVLIGAIADGGEGALKGGLIGGAAGGAAVLATRGVEVELKAGTLYTIELRKSLTVD
jgi:hypothetical protein